MTTDTLAADRLRLAREKAGFDSARGAAERLGFNPDTYPQYENGTRGFRRHVETFAQAFRVDVNWLLTGKGEMSSRTHATRLVGYVGAGEEVYPIDDHEKGGGLAGLPAVQGLEGAVAVEVRGDSMRPVYRPGDALYYRQRFGQTVESLIGRECVVQIQDGPMLVKIIRPGRRKGCFDLHSYNADPLEDQAIAWAAPVEFVKRAR